MIERWRPVVGFEGLYEVSDQGRVRSLDRPVERRNPYGVYPGILPGRLLKLTIRKGGYPTLWMTDPVGVRRIQRVHRLVLAAFVGAAPEGTEGCHNNGEPADNRLNNLRWDTPSENARDSVRHGTNAHTRRTHCPRGHALVPSNLRPDKLKQCRDCWACSRASTTAYLSRRSGVDIDWEALADQYYQRFLAGWRPAPSTNRTHCPHGHELVEPNLELGKLRRGRRGCRSCAYANASACKTRRRTGRELDKHVLADQYYGRIMSERRESK